MLTARLTPVPRAPSMGAVLFLAGLALAACQTPLLQPADAEVGSGETESKGEGESDSRSDSRSATAEADDGRVSWRLYTPFFDQGDHLAKLVGEGAFEDAAKLFEEQGPYFAENRKQAHASLRRLAENLNADQTPGLTQALRRLDAIDWPAVRAGLEAAAARIDAYPALAILGQAEYRAPQLDRLEAATARLRGRIEADAAGRFVAFDHFGEASFFDAYPTGLARTALLDGQFGQLQGWLNAAGSAALRRFSANYPQALIGAERWRQVGGLYVAALLEEAGTAESSGLAAVLGAVRAAKAAGFDPRRVPGLGIGFVEVTSKTLLAEGQIDFAAAVDVDLPFDVAETTLDEALTNPTATASDYLIVFDVALAKATRRVGGMEGIASTILAGQRSEPNRDYTMALLAYQEAETAFEGADSDMEAANNADCSRGGCLAKLAGQIIAGGRLMSARDDMDEAKAKLGAMAMTIQVPVYRDYRFNKASVKASKAMTVHYYVIDRRRNTYFKSTFDVEESAEFDVAYNVHDADPKKDEIIGQYGTEDAVAEWEEAPVTVALSQLVDHYL